ncbi:MAG: hypothetical protein PHF05_00835 [Candidatus Izemoplasmatales bacterium]|nr:hypothetical protein [Candidatus Izemoplasmatales bacterium]MDD4068980.1 hypothetical protein [Candidatus Izemoplasmatales bacterium]MDY0138319.1 hypothetical protein [Candidatus Izemoplasmatales bacterium]
MKKLLKEYQSWLIENKKFYEHLKNHNSSLYTRFQPVFDVLNHLHHEFQENNEYTEDIEKIFQVGLEYINLQFFTCKVYLEKTFNSDFHQFLSYDQVISYSLFVEDLKYELIEKSIDYDGEELEKLSNYLQEIIEEKKEIPDNLNLYVDSRIHRVIKEDDYHFTGIIDIFVEIGDALGIEIDEDLEYVVGEDI